MGIWSFIRNMFLFDWMFGNRRKVETPTSHTNNYTSFNHNCDCGHDYIHPYDSGYAHNSKDDGHYAIEDYYYDSHDEYAHDYDDFDDDFWAMKNFLFTLLLLMSVFCASAQKMYSVAHRYQADIKVFVTDTEYRADLVVFKTDKEYRVKSNENKGIWYFTDSQFRADKKIFFVDHEYQADLVVFFTDKEYRAGWKKNEKKHLLY